MTAPLSAVRTGGERAFPPAPADIVYAFSFVTWAAAARRELCFSEDRLVETMLDHPRVGGLLVCEPFRSLPLKLVRGLYSTPKVTFPADEKKSLYGPVRLRRSEPTSPRAAERSARAYEQRIKTAATRAGLRRPAVITANPLLAGFGRFDWAGPVTYYGIDDWTASLPHRPWWPVYRRAYELMGTRGRRVCAVSDAVIERIAPRGPSLTVPNGLDPREWETRSRAPAWFTRRPAPRLLYVGALDERLDLPALLAVSTRFRTGSVTLVGPQVARQPLDALRGQGNVEIRPPVPRSEVAALVGNADVCLIPHRRTNLTTAMSPLKLYEYLAGGAPVAASDLPPIRLVESPRLVLQSGGTSFADAVARALEVGRADEDERLAFVDYHAWARRHEDLLAFALD